MHRQDTVIPDVIGVMIPGSIDAVIHVIDNLMCFIDTVILVYQWYDSSCYRCLTGITASIKLIMTSKTSGITVSITGIRASILTTIKASQHR